MEYLKKKMAVQKNRQQGKKKMSVGHPIWTPEFLSNSFLNVYNGGDALLAATVY